MQAGFKAKPDADCFEPNLAPASVMDVMQESAAGKGEENSFQTRVHEGIFLADDLNYPICYLRFLTSAYMKAHSDEFAPFVMGIHGDQKAKRKNAKNAMDNKGFLPLQARRF